MIKYYSYAIMEKLLSFTPAGNKIVYGLSSLIEKNSKGRDRPLDSAIKLVKNARDMVKPGDTILDVGTGWYHHLPFLFYLIGDYEHYLFDVKDKASLQWIKNYLLGLQDKIDVLFDELKINKYDALSKIKYLFNQDSRDKIYDICNFKLIITKETDRVFLPENSVNLMVSCCVINHIPIEILMTELITLKKIIKPDGIMYFLIGHDDHWSFHDPSMNMFQYYKYSDKYYKMIFENNFQFQNRLTKNEWLDIFNTCGLNVIDYYGHITAESRNEINKLSNDLNQRFSKYSLTDLSIKHSYVTLAKLSDN